MMRNRLVSVLAVIVLVTLAGCGGAISDGATTPNETTGTTPDSPSEPRNELPANSNGTLSVNYINIGQGSSTLIVGPTNETMLIDSGDWSDDGEDVLAYLRKHDIDRIDYLVTTHADADHIGGHEAVIDYFETEGDGVGTVYDPGITSTSQTYQGYLDAIEEHNVTLYETRAGDRIPFEGVETEVLAPPEGYLANGDRNENSIVVRLGFGQSNFVLPGDGATASERFLVDEYGATLNATVLSAGHHGSRSSSGSEFLDVTDPRIAVISSAYDSQYGHPHDEVLKRFSQRTIRTYWTATHGNVQLTSNGSAIAVATQYEAPTAPLELRNGEPMEPNVGDALQKRTVIPVDESAAVPDGGTTDEPTEPTDQEGTLSVVTIHEDASGNDNDNLNDEYLVFENTGDQPLELGGWSVADAADHTYTFPSGVTLDPGARVTLHTGSGTDSSSDLYWDFGRAVWNNGGDTVVVRNDSGTIVLQEEY
ncbi:lamin tail domain-containing protein (plasmid) [Natrinema zhouii]|uniref:lamin tail domain-containing protein n=1 Tax=Natrinema zhouii TaxID=1710539 RepID=UPI001D0013FB|nr:lamin tail domain-containing protein [Natrinema zhouii]UHQ98797.1 lamin tail domain-containing protein [Natrinema zhouii]